MSASPTLLSRWRNRSMIAASKKTPSDKAYEASPLPEVVVGVPDHSARCGSLGGPHCARSGLLWAASQLFLFIPFSNFGVYYTLSHDFKQEYAIIPNPQVAAALPGLKPVMVQVKLALALHPSGAAEKAQNLTPPHVKNVACGFGIILT